MENTNQKKEFDASNEPTIALPFFYKITTDKCE